MRSLHAFVVLGLALSLAACASGAPPQQQQPYWAPRPPQAGPYIAPPLGQPFSAPRPVNVPAMIALRGKSHCAPREAAPGVWIHMDCGPHRFALRAHALIVPRRSGLVGAGSLPDSVDHRVDGSEGPVKDQGEVGVCTAFSLSTAMDNAIRRMGRQDVTSPLHVWSKYEVPEMGVAGDDTVDKSVTLEQTWPYDPAKACKMLQQPGDSCGVAYSVQSDTASADPQIRSEQASADSQGRYRIDAVEQFASPINTNDIAAVLAGGDDVWAAFSVDDGNAWTGRTASNPVIPDYQADEDEGHAIVLAGYRTVNGSKQFLVHNSWSANWGDHGYGWLSEAMVSRWLRSAYKVKVADASAPAQPQVGPAPAPNSGNCASGQVPDAVLQTCVAPCPSGSPPAAGVCLPTIPGFPVPGMPAAPAGPSACAQGQTPDLMTGKCANMCPGNLPSVGGMCMPTLPH